MSQTIYRLEDRTLLAGLAYTTTILDDYTDQAEAHAEFARELARHAPAYAVGGGHRLVLTGVQVRGRRP